MTVQTINVGARVNDETAETVYSAFTKTNSNFSDLDTRISSAESTVTTLSADMTELQGLFGTDVEAATFTTKQNDLAVAAGTRILRWNGAGTTGITGITAPSTARVVTIVNASTDYLLWLENENTASAAANRFMLPDSFPAFLMPGDTITLFYDLTTTRWRVLEWPTRGPAMGLLDFTDFTIADVGQVKSVVNGTGAAVQHTNSSAVRDVTIGAVQCITGTTSTGRAAVTYGSAISLRPSLIRAGLSIAKAAASSATNATETFATHLGFANIGGGAFTDGAAWEYRWDGAGAVLTHTTAAASALTRSSAIGSVTITNQNWFGVYLNVGATRADFILSTDGVAFSLSGSVSTGLPSGAQYTAIGYGIIKSVGVSARALYMDLCGSRVVR